MQTMDRPVAGAAPTVPTRRPWWMLAIAVGLALVLGALGGWLAARATEDDPTAIVVGGGSLTDRQQQMVDRLDGYLAAWQSDDAAAVTAFFAPGGWFVRGGQTYRADDGTLEGFVNGASWSTLQDLDPVLVDGNQASFLTTFSGMRWFNVVEFTATGDVLIVRHVSTG